jgi:hypothetical protein
MTSGRDRRLALVGKPRRGTAVSTLLFSSCWRAIHVVGGLLAKRMSRQHEGLDYEIHVAVALNDWGLSMLRESFERAKRVQATTAWGHSSAAIITLDHLPAESSAQWCQGSANRPILRQNPERRPRTGQPTVCKRDKTAGREMSGEFLDLCWWHDIDSRIQPTRHQQVISSLLFSSLLFFSLSLKAQGSFI